MNLDDDYRDLAPSSDIQQLLEIMRRLRDPHSGCPWDKKQTFETIIPYTIEEAYEVKDAVERRDMADLCDELGDLLLQVVYHCEIAKEQGAFDFGHVVEAITSKMLRRHPHVFGNQQQRQQGLQKGQWDKIKEQEQAQKARQKTDDPSAVRPRHLDRVPVALPALSRALHLQKRAARVGFDWDDVNLVFDKLREEFDELQIECAKPDHANNRRGEMGDILFATVNLARHLAIDPETALDETNLKFIKRFNYIEQELQKQDKKLGDASLDEMEALWQEAKSQ